MCILDFTESFCGFNVSAKYFKYKCEMIDFDFRIFVSARWNTIIWNCETNMLITFYRWFIWTLQKVLGGFEVSVRIFLRNKIIWKCKSLCWLLSANDLFWLFKIEGIWQYIDLFHREQSFWNCRTYIREPRLKPRKTFCANQDYQKQQMKLKSC
jgi:hypothetical protein